MADLKITVEQVKNYLGTGLIMEYSGYGEKKPLDKWSISVQENWDIHFMDDGQTDDDVLFYFKPICYRLSDLDKEIEHNGERFIPAEKLLPHYKKCDYRLSGNILEKLNPKAKNSWGFRYVNIENMKYPDIQKIFEWHYWPFGDEYFEQGLVIDKRKDGSNV